MAGYGTAKMDTTDLNVGFPSAFSRAYARHGSAKKYYPEGKLPSMDNTVGSDFQAEYHQQKMRDANHYARAKVEATHAHNARAFSSAHGYYKMPRPVLGQRIFANISSGAFNTHSTREDQPSAHAPFIEVPNGQAYASRVRQNEGVSSVKLEGGVLRTSAGQRHGIATLEARIAQLNAINEAKGSWGANSKNYTDFAGALATFDTMLTGTSMVELSNLLQNVKYTLIEMNQSDSTQRDLFSDLSKALPLVVILAVNNPPADIANILQFIEGTSAKDGISQLLEDRISAFQSAGRELVNEALGGSDAVQGEKSIRYAERLTALLEFWNRLTEYLKEMMKIAEQPLKTRQNASDALISGLGFAKLNKQISDVYKTNVVPDDLFIDATNNIHNFRNAQRAVEFSSRAGSSGAMINPLTRAKNTYSSSAKTREDSQQGSHVVGVFGFGVLEDANRVQNMYAFGSGEFQDNTGGRPRAWAGEEVVAEYGEAPPAEAVPYEAERETREAVQDVALDKALAELRRRETANPDEEKAKEADIASLEKQYAEAGKKVSSTTETKTYEYKLSDIPSGEGIWAWIDTLNKKHPELQYSPSPSSERASVRAYLVRRLRKEGLMAP